MYVYNKLFINLVYAFISIIHPFIHVIILSSIYPLFVCNMVEISDDSHERVLKLKYIIDMDGFEIDRKFLAKELAIIHMDSGLIESHYFRVGHFKDLSLKQRYHVNWIRKHIHGLKFSDSVDDKSQAQLYEILTAICEDAQDSNMYVGYKGGHFEKDLIYALGFEDTAFNIENWNCPKLETLVDAFPAWRHELSRIRCDRHESFVIDKKSKNRIAPHCPRVEVWCFRLFMQKNMM